MSSLDSQPEPRELLDLEDDDARRHRIQSLLESTNSKSAPASVPHARQDPPPSLPLSKPHPVPVSELISRAEAFLPRLAASNSDLARKAAADPASVDIEHLGEPGEAGSHIEMNLGLGVFSHRAPPNRTSTSKSKRRASTSTPPTAIFGPSSTSSDSDCDGRASENVDYSDEDDTTTSGSDSDSDEEALVPIDIDEKTLGDRQGVGRNMPSILVLASEDQADTGG